MPIGVKTVSSPNRVISSMRRIHVISVRVRESLVAGTMPGVWGYRFAGARLKGWFSEMDGCAWAAYLGRHAGICPQKYRRLRALRVDDRRPLSACQAAGEL